MIRNLKATLVSVAEVKALVAKGVGPGRPKNIAESKNFVKMPKP